MSRGARLFKMSPYCCAYCGGPKPCRLELACFHCNARICVSCTVSPLFRPRRFLGIVSVDPQIPEVGNRVGLLGPAQKQPTFSQFSEHRLPAGNRAPVAASLPSLPTGLKGVPAHVSPA